MTSTEQQNTETQSEPIPQLLLNSAEAAKMLSVAEQTLYNSRTSGLLFGKKAPPHVKLGRSVRYRPQAIRNWVSAL